MAKSQVKFGLRDRQKFSIMAKSQIKSYSGHVIFPSFQRRVSKAIKKLPVFTSFFQCLQLQGFLGSRKFLSVT